MLPVTPFDMTCLQPGDTLLFRPTKATWSPSTWIGAGFGGAIAMKTWHNIAHVEVYVGLSQESPFAVEERSAAVFGPVVGAGRVWYPKAPSTPFTDRASVASRDGRGVDVYPIRVSELAYVLRPPAGSFNLAPAWAWFLANAQGQGYDWLGLSRFVRTKVIATHTKMFCSAFWLRFYRAGGFHPFNARIDADSICPGEILDAPALETVWCDGQDDFGPGEVLGDGK